MDLMLQIFLDANKSWKYLKCLPDIVTVVLTACSVIVYGSRTVLYQSPGCLKARGRAMMM